MREEVSASQRGRLLVAMCDAVGEKGYAAATVADVLAAGGLSRRTFYVHFPDKESCFLAAYDHGCGALTAAVDEAVAAAGDGWRAQADAALSTTLAAFAQEPGFARAVLVEAWTAGPAVAERHALVVAWAQRLLRQVHESAREQERGVRPVSDRVLAAIAGGLSRLAALEVLAGRAHDLPALAPEARDFAFPLLAGEGG